MTKKIYDLAVKTGEYQKDGQTKGRYQNVGAILQKEDGGKFILLERWFNPAGITGGNDNSSVIISMFPPKQYGDNKPTAKPPEDEAFDKPSDDDVPF